MPLNARVHGRADAGCTLLFTVGGLDTADGRDDGIQDKFGIAGTRPRQNLEHRLLEVPALLLGVPGAQSRF
jgi:hypothetical protein